MEVNGVHQLFGYLPPFFKTLPMCSPEERHLYRFGTTWGWV